MVLINGMCLFADEIKTAVRELAERTFLTYTYSKRTYTRYLLIQRRNASRNGGEEANAELDG